MTIDFATAPHARIYTSWSTVIYFDAVSGELRHGPIETSPENVVFVADPASTETARQGWLMQLDGDRLEPIACGPLGCRTVSAADPGDPPPAATLLELVILERGLVAFRAESHFLCAQPDWRVDLSKPWCSTWECFLASEGWCSMAPAIDDRQAPINWIAIRKMLIDPRLRIKVNAASSATKILIYGYPYWSHGRVYHDICKYLHVKGYLVDIINWQVNHSDYIGELKSFYDLFISALDGVSTLVDVYGVPYEQVIALSHHEMDMRVLIDQKGVEVFDKFAGYCVVGYQLFDASAIFGITREPMVVQLGVDLSEFQAEIPERLTTVGYASSFSQKTIHGVEIKRGQLAEAATREAGLAFRVAGSTADQTSIHDMPEFYRSVDAILVSSVTEGAQLPIREAAAAGRLVISTPVGDFPLRAYQGTGIIAPIESEKYRKFAAAQLQYYKDNPEAFADICREIQTAARQLDWQNMISDWVELIEATKARILEMARSHQEAGRFADAAMLFAKRAAAGGDEEASWYARWEHARCVRELGNEKAFVRIALQSFQERPHRAEPLHDLANYYLAKQQAAPAALYAEAALAIPKPERDVLAVDPGLYEFGLRHGFAAIASWSSDPEVKERGRKICDWLALSRDVPQHIRDPARYNSGWYVAPAQSLLPGLRFHALTVEPPDGFHPANISITRYGDGFIALVRAVNWILKDGFWYVLQSSPPYKSHVLLLRLDREFQIVESADVLPPDDMPVPENCDVDLHHDLGFADPRPFVWRDELWCISIVRQLNEQALSEMVLARIDMSRPGRYLMTDWRVVPSGMPARHEKNWMPQVVGDELRLIYSIDPTRILSDSGAVLHNAPAPIVADSFRGGSQAIQFDGGWLMVIHEVEQVGDRRRYFHRFVWLDAGNAIRRLSRRFYFCQPGIEFAAGLAWHPDGQHVAVSVSLDDFDLLVAALDADELRTVLLEIDLHRRASRGAIDAAACSLEKIKAMRAVHPANYRHRGLDCRGHAD